MIIALALQDAHVTDLTRVINHFLHPDREFLGIRDRPRLARLRDRILVQRETQLPPPPVERRRR